MAWQQSTDEQGNPYWYEIDPNTGESRSSRISPETMGALTRVRSSQGVGPDMGAVTGRLVREGNLVSQAINPATGQLEDLYRVYDENGVPSVYFASQLGGDLTGAELDVNDPTKKGEGGFMSKNGWAVIGAAPFAAAAGAAALSGGSYGGALGGPFAGSGGALSGGAVTPVATEGALGGTTGLTTGGTTGALGGGNSIFSAPGWEEGLYSGLEGTPAFNAASSFSPSTAASIFDSPGWEESMFNGLEGVSPKTGYPSFLDSPGWEEGLSNGLESTPGYQKALGEIIGKVGPQAAPGLISKLLSGDAGAADYLKAIGIGAGVIEGLTKNNSTVNKTEYPEWYTRGAQAAVDKAISIPGYTPYTPNTERFMNPYIKGALDPAADAVNRNFDKLQNENDAKATMRGAFGGSRATLAGQAVDTARGRSLGDLYGKGYADAYDKAQSLDVTDQNASREWPIKQVGAIATALRGTGDAGRTSTTTPPSPSIVGGVIGGLGALDSAQKAGIF